VKKFHAPVNIEKNFM